MCAWVKKNGSMFTNFTRRPGGGRRPTTHGQLQLLTHKLVQEQHWCECQISQFQSRYFRQFRLYLHTTLCSHTQWICATCTAGQRLRTGLCPSAVFSHACYMSRPHTFPSVDHPNTELPFISTSILSHTVLFHLLISTYIVKLVAGTILQLIFGHLVHILCVCNKSN